MRKELMNYEALLKFTRDISITRDPEQVVFPIVESVARVLEAKGCALFLFNPEADKLELAASHGLSDEYLNKGPISSIRSIALSLQDGPVAISDVADDPRIQYPEEAKKEGICSMLSVPIIMHRDPIGALRVYSGIPWEATLENVNFVQAMAQLAGMALEMCRLYKGLKDRIEILEMTRGPKPMDGQKP
ncbi:GAF domain-containing protein [Thermodesulfobacteriota bacterium]